MNIPIATLYGTSPYIPPSASARECSEEELAKRIEELVSGIENMETAIFNFHAPPYASGLDEAPELSKDLDVKYAGKVLVPVGSTAVKEAIEKYQPLLGLHGHIHESRAVTNIGRTLCVNPGALMNKEYFKELS